MDPLSNRFEDWKIFLGANWQNLRDRPIQNFKISFSECILRNQYIYAVSL